MVVISLSQVTDSYLLWSQVFTI